MSAIPDADARARIVEGIDSTLFVEAGAGSGKTGSLVTRFVALVLDGTEVTAIAAITFTEAAAAELRSRVREALEDLVAGDDLRGIERPSAQGIERVRAALDQLDEATICTLHAFAQRVLLSAPVESGLPPDVDVHDEVSSALVFDERWRRFERRLLDDDDLESTMRCSLVLGIKPADMRRIATTLSQNWDQIATLDLSHDLAQAPDPKQLSCDAAVACLRRAVERAELCTDPDDLLRRWLLDDLPDRIAEYESASDPYRRLEVMLKEPPRFRHGKAANWPDGGKAQVAEDLADAATAINSETDDLTQKVLRRLSAHLADYTREEAAARLRDGRLEFHDLLVLARRVLRDDAGVRRRLHERFQYLLIDEFQDTDPIQIELAVRIAADPDHDPSVPWDRVDAVPGRLFFVGDPKQSIYRFRRADIALFAQAQQRYSDGETKLTTNFRTAEPILDVVNAVFGQLMGAGADRDGEDGRPGVVAQPPYQPLDAARKRLDDDPGKPVVAFGGAQEAKAEPVRIAEATDVAALLARAHTEGWLVQPDRSPEPRRAKWSDMAILLPSRTSLPYLRDALDAAEVPYRLETGSLVYATTEIRDVLAVLRSIDDPGDEVALIGALRSPAYACGDDDLAEWHRAGHPWSYLPDASQDAAEHPVGRAMADLRDRYRTRPFRTVPEVVEAVVRQRRLMEVALAGSGHRDAWRLYRIVIEHARLFADSEPGSLREFIGWAELQADEKLRATVPVLPEADVDAVRVLTIHGSKGLEFGIVVVSGMSGLDPRTVTGPQVIFGETGGFDVRIRSGLESTQYQAQRTLEDVMDEHERIRLLYVALTRARDHLLVSCHHKNGKVKSQGQRVHRAIDSVIETGGAWDDDVMERIAGTDAATVGEGDAGEAADPVSLVPEPPTQSTVALWADLFDEWDRHRSASVEVGRRGGAIAATAIARHLLDAGDASSEARGPGSERDPLADPPEEEPWRRGRAGTSVGSAVHAVMQHTDLADPSGADVADLAVWQAQVEGIPEAASEIERKVRAALASDIVRDAVRARHWREVHVGALVDRPGETGGGDEEVLVLEGFIDLMYETAEGLVVVDYKTDAVRSRAQVTAALARYAPQGAAYALAVEAVTGRPVARVVFLFLAGDEAVAVEVPDLESEVERVRRAAATI